MAQGSRLEEKLEMFSKILINTQKYKFLKLCALGVRSVRNHQDLYAY
jgi:hypothetical protein